MNDRLFGIVTIIVALAIITFFSFLFANCYSEHRTNGLGVGATISTCS